MGRDPLSAARAALARARGLLAARLSRAAVAQAHLACRLAGEALRSDSGLYAPAPGAGAGGPAAFYRRLDGLARRLEADRRSQLHVEEAAGWVRQAAWFVERMEQMARRG